MTRAETITKCGAEPLTAESHRTADGLSEVMGRYL